jgi:hypothetical protein
MNMIPKKYRLCFHTWHLTCALSTREGQRCSCIVGGKEGERTRAVTKAPCYNPYTPYKLYLSGRDQIHCALRTARSKNRTVLLTDNVLRSSFVVSWRMFPSDFPQIHITSPKVVNSLVRLKFPVVPRVHV